VFGIIRKFVTVFGTVGILAGGVFLIMLMGSLRPKVRPEAPVVTPPTVFFTVAAPKSVTLDVFAQGEVRPRTDITLTAQVSGRIVDTSDEFVDGGAFDEGDLLVKIEDADYKLQVTGARARVAQALEQLRKEEAESALAKEDYAELGRKSDPSELALRLPQLAQAKAGYEAAQADHRSALLALERTEIRAPFKGRVRNRIAGEGQFVGPGAQLGRIFSTDVAEIRLPLTDEDLAKLGIPLAFVETAEVKGPPVALSAAVAGQNRQWLGRIARTDAAVDPQTRQISAIAVVDDPYGAGADDGTPLAVGLFVDALIEGRPYDNAIVVPRSALYGRDVVFVIDKDNRVHKRVVVVVSADRDTITIASGVGAGDKIATSPLRGADEGSEVLPVDPLAADPPSGDQEPNPAAAQNAAAGDAL
jgi:RND family efflux transporter MFP subunit